MALTAEFVKSSRVYQLRNDPRGMYKTNEVKPIITFTGVEIARSVSAWKQKNLGYKIKEFRTEFILYRSKAKYYLNILGISSDEKDQTFSRVIEFVTPEELFAIIDDTDDNRIYLSDPVVALVLDISKTDFVDSAEKENWLKPMTTKGD